MAQDIDFVVNGERFSISQDILAKYPNSFFTTITAQPWRQEDCKDAIEIERDNVLFRYIVDFMRVGCLPRNREGQSYLDEEILNALLIEADYYQLRALFVDCQTLLHFRENDAFRSYTQWRNQFHGFASFYQVFRRVLHSNILDQLRSFIKPTCFGGDSGPTIYATEGYRKSILREYKVEALLPLAVPVGREGVLELPTDVATEILSNQFEIAQLICLRDIEHMMDTEFDIITNKILIYPPGVSSRPQPWQRRLPEQVGSVLHKLAQCHADMTVECEDTSQPCNYNNWVALFDSSTYAVMREEEYRAFAVFDLVPRSGYKKRRVSDLQSDIHVNNTNPDFPETYISRNDCNGAILDRSVLLFHASYDDQPRRILALVDAVHTKLLTCPRIAIALIHPYFCTDYFEDCGDDQNFKQELHGADRALYQILSEKFEVRIVPVVVEKGDCETDSSSSYYCNMYFHEPEDEVSSIEEIDFYMLNHTLYNAAALSVLLQENASHLLRAMYIKPKHTH